MSYEDPYRPTRRMDPQQGYDQQIPIPQPPQQMPVQPYSAQPYSVPPVNPYGPQQIVVTMPTVPSSGVAVWAMVMGIVGILTGWCLLGLPCLLAVILGHVGVAETKNNNKSGRGMAVAGLALGYVALVPAIIVFLMFVVGSIGAVGTTAP